MSSFANGFCLGAAMTRRPFGMLTFGTGLYGCGYGLTQEAVISSPLIFSCYADLDSPSGLSSAFPSVTYAMNRSFYGGLSGFSYPGIGFGACGLDGLGFGGIGLGYGYGGYGIGCGCYTWC